VSESHVEARDIADLQKELPHIGAYGNCIRCIWHGVL